jgi:hypothetical protein
MTVSFPLSFPPKGRGYRFGPLPVRLLFLSVLLLAFAAKSELTNAVAVDTEARALAARIYFGRPETNASQSGSLKLRDPDGKISVIPLRLDVIITPTNWQTIYLTGSSQDQAGSLLIVHADGQPNRYFADVNANPETTRSLTASERLSPLTPGSDFSRSDLGLEFLHWPEQRILKKEFHRQCACVVLESTNPHPSAHGYSRVVSWIDEESLGRVEAYAYDVNDLKLKNFYPKNLEKINGRYQVESMVMENLQTGSRSVFELDAHK